MESYDAVTDGQDTARINVDMHTQSISQSCPNDILYNIVRIFVDLCIYYIIARNMILCIILCYHTYIYIYIHTYIHTHTHYD